MFLIKYTFIFSEKYMITKNKFFYKNKKILFISPALGGGGAERIICRLASEFSKKYIVYLIFFFHRENEYYISQNVQLIQINKNCTKKVELLRFVENVINKYKIDVIINFLRWFDEFDVNISKKTKIIFSERGDPIHSKIYNFSITKEAYKKADIIVFQTKYARDLFPKDIQKKGVIIPNPVAVECLSTNNITSKKIVNVARIVPNKNQELLIQAFSIFQKSHKKYNLYIYGVGNLLDQLKELVKSKNLENSVHFEGFSQHIHENIKDAEFFVLSSDYEGSPNSLMEAMMMGIPSISTNCSGINEIITDKVNGLLVPINNVSSLANAMSILSDNMTLRNIIRRGALKTSEKWNTQKIIRKWEKLFY